MTICPFVALKDICTRKGEYGVGLASRPWEPGDPRYIRITDVTSAGELTSTQVAPSGSESEWSRAILEPGDLLFARSGATVGKTYLHSIENDPAVYAGYLIRFRLDPAVADSRFVFHYSQTTVYHAWVRSTQRTVAQPNINAKQYGDLPIPLPPLHEQRRVAEILDQATDLRALRENALLATKELGRAAFRSHFPSFSSIRRVPLMEAAAINSGITMGRKIKGQATRSVPFMAVVNVQDKFLNLGTIKTIEATEDEIARYRLERDDLLLTEGGDPDKLGRGTLWQDELPESIHQNHIFRVRPNKSVVNPKFLSWAIGSTYGKSHFLRLAKQTTGIASINMTQLKQFPLPLPPLSEQEAFAETIEKIDSMSVLQNSFRQTASSLVDSLQAAAFAGRLPQPRTRE